MRGGHSAQQDDAGDRRADGAGARPHGIAGADGQAAKRHREQDHAEDQRDGEQHARAELREPFGLLERERQAMPRIVEG